MNRLSLFAALILAFVSSSAAYAGKGGTSSGGRSSFSSSSGRSYSSGPSSSSRSSSSSSSGRSFSANSNPGKTSPSGSSLSGRSYTSRSSPTAPASSPSKSISNKTSPAPSGPTARPTPPTNPSPSPKTSPLRPHGGRFDSAAAAAQKQAESRTAFQKARASAPSGKYPEPTPGPQASRLPKGKSYASGGGTVATPPTTKSGARASYDSAAARAQRQQESQTIFEKGQAPKTQYADAQNKVRPVDPKDQRIEELRRQLDHERWVNRDWRLERVFTPYYPRPVVVYQDPYSSFFWWWLLDQSLDQRAGWAYHHRELMDQARYRDLLAKDTQLEARIRDLEAKGVQRDPAFAPSGIDPDLMYTTEYVEAAYNPQVVTVPTSPVNSADFQPPRAKAPLRSALGVVVAVLAVPVFLAFVAWLVFFRRWGS